MAQTRFAEWLLEQMDRNNRETPAELSRATGVAASSISAYLNGPTKPSMEIAAKIAAHFGVEVSEVMLVINPASDLPPSSEDAVIADIRKRLAKMSPEEQREFALPAIELAEKYLRAARRGEGR